MSEQQHFEMHCETIYFEAKTMPMGELPEATFQIGKPEEEKVDGLGQ